MSAIPAITIFDIGKTNKKVLVFDQSYKILFEHSEQLSETVDDDGDPCEDVVALTNWVKKQWSSVLSNSRWDVKALNVSAYGASFVHIDKNGAPAGPLYNYLKPLPAHLRKSFHEAYPRTWSQTASPDLDNLNSGIQLYMIRHAKPSLFANIQTSLHLPQYLAFLLHGKAFADLTSLGCHTAMWDFTSHRYAAWVAMEGLLPKQAALQPSNSIVEIEAGNKIIYSGIGLHDSSAALIPYLTGQQEQFVLISTGTWCITLNPFNDAHLTDSELSLDCLCYLSYQGKPVKASRLFSGHFHDLQIRALAEHFNKQEDYYKTIHMESVSHLYPVGKKRDLTRPFEVFNPSSFSDYDAAYIFLIEELVARQVASTSLVMSEGIRNIFIDGGFSSNELFMTLLARAFPNYRISAANVAQASALGAALAIHSSWNKTPIPSGLLSLKSYRG